MLGSRPEVPTGHGEVVTLPEYAEWADLMGANRHATADWSFDVAGRPVGEVRGLVRRECLELGRTFSARMGVAVAEPGEPEDAIVMTGHQPELYHPGVWVKDFLMQRLSRQTGASAVDIVVDSDSFDTLGITSPCVEPEVRRCSLHLAIGEPDRCFACTPGPAADEVDRFGQSASEMLSTLPAPAVARHFEAFITELRAATQDAETLAETITFARRRYEASAGTDYLELPVTHMTRTEGWAWFVADIALNAGRFAETYNSELAEYRRITRTRSSAQPFPDLSCDDELIELPLWALEDRKRSTVFARNIEAGVELIAAGRVVATVTEGDEAVSGVLSSAALIAPKALVLTLFARVFACDLFIHGVGGGRYDRVTDGVCRRYYGVEPPHYAVASMTMYLPLAGPAVNDDEIAEAKDRINRLQHNPDALLGEIDFEDTAERDRAIFLAAEKRRLVGEISAPDADKKSIGLRIRAVNSELSEILRPLEAVYSAELTRLERQQAAAEVLTDRTYPFCFWSPREVAEKVL